ncbi:3-hydroxyisobutyrate dehydrogenase [Pedomonas sp. V897]|uniref:3-hydroxyisobutyrate dehydrogenase n=1 Tax=Pedomonas sp. V897 TaxID=3446482 RepID=UPI003EDFEF67
MATVAFIGVGNMGGGMAVNLAKAGHRVLAYDLLPANLEKVVEQGCEQAESVASAVAQADAVVTMLPAGKHVRQVYETEVFLSARPGTLMMDCSTIDVATARDVVEAATAKGFVMVDAPVSGGVAAAAGGTLTFMVGGTDEAFKAAEPYLTCMGKAVIHAGDAGAGQAAKICNNMLLGISMIGTCEAFNLAQKLGLDPQRFFDISSKASGQCWSMTSYCPVPGPVPTAPSNRNYEGGFAAALMLKDLRLAMEAAQKVGAPTPLGAEAESLYAIFSGMGGAGKDFSAIIKMLAGEWKG